MFALDPFDPEALDPGCPAGSTVLEPVRQLTPVSCIQTPETTVRAGLRKWLCLLYTPKGCRSTAHLARGQHCNARRVVRKKKTCQGFQQASSKPH